MDDETNGAAQGGERPRRMTKSSVTRRARIALTTTR